jgi:DNA-directed RNA polymerase subunit alpha
MIEPQFTTKKVEETQDYGHFVIEPLPISFAHSMGHSLRRTLLSSLPGAALTQIRVDGASHHFSTLKGVKESVLDILLNLKQLRFQTPGEGQYRINISAKGAQKIYGKDIEGEAKVVNGDLYIAELTDDKAKLEIEGIVETGIGFVASEEKENKETGFVAIDSSFSPVKRVNFKVEEARVGRKADYERLILEIWTDGTIHPEDALKKSTEMLAAHFAYVSPAGSAVAASEEGTASTAEAKTDEAPSKLDDIIIDELNLPSRVINALLRENIETVADLLKTGRKRLMVLKGVDRKSIDLIDDELKKMNITLE